MLEMQCTELMYEDKKNLFTQQLKKNYSRFSGKQVRCYERRISVQRLEKKRDFFTCQTYLRGNFFKNSCDIFERA